MTLTFDLWPWPFAWPLPLSLFITPEIYMMMRWWKHSQKCARQTDRWTENTIHKAALSQLKYYRSRNNFFHSMWYTIITLIRWGMALLQLSIKAYDLFNDEYILLYFQQPTISEIKVTYYVKLCVRSNDIVSHILAFNLFVFAARCRR